MIQIKLINVKEKENKSYYIIYKPIKYNENLEYKIIIKSDFLSQIQFVIYAVFIDWINFTQSDNSNNKLYKYNYLPNNGLFISLNINKNNDFIIIFKPLDECTNIKLKYINKFNINQLTLNNNCKYNNIFIINLERRTDRKEQMIKKLNDANINLFEFINAFDGLDPLILKQFNKIKENKQNLIISSGHFACLLSHIKAIELAKSRNYDNIMILEDDIFFCDNFLNKLDNLIIPKYDMLYLGGIMSRKKVFISDWAYSTNSYKIMGAYAYILSKNIFDEVLLNLSKLLDYVDLTYIKKIQNKYKVIILNDFIKTDLSSSDTSNKSKKLIKRLKYIE